VTTARARPSRRGPAQRRRSCARRDPCQRRRQAACRLGRGNRRRLRLRSCFSHWREDGLDGYADPPLALRTDVR
jgi:hypothetical protein